VVVETGSVFLRRYPGRRDDNGKNGVLSGLKGTGERNLAWQLVKLQGLLLSVTQAIPGKVLDACLARCRIKPMLVTMQWFSIVII
jgi:hypothetical protein